MPTARKKVAVKELQELFTSTPVLIFTDYRGLSVSDITNLRRQLRDKGVEYHVTKNTLTTLAADKAGLGDMGKLLDGPTAIAFVGDDIQGAAKVLTDFVRTSRILQIRGGLMGHTMISADQVGDLTRLLTREQYIARLLGTMQSPVSGMVGALAGVIRNFMNVMQARIDQLKEQGEPEAEAPTETPTEARLEAPAAVSPNGAAPAAAPEVVTPVASVAEPVTPVAEPAAPQEMVAEAPTVTPAEEATPVASTPEPAPAAPEAMVAEAPAEAAAESTPVASMAELAAPTEIVAETPAEAPADEVATPEEVETPDAGTGEESA